MLTGKRARLFNNPQLGLSITLDLLEQVNHMKLLGVTINNGLSWSQHINSAARKMGKGLTVARKYSACSSSSIMKVAVVLSHLEYY